MEDGGFNRLLETSLSLASYCSSLEDPRFLAYTPSIARNVIKCQARNMTSNISIWGGAPPHWVTWGGGGPEQRGGERSTLLFRFHFATCTFHPFVISFCTLHSNCNFARCTSIVIQFCTLLSSWSLFSIFISHFFICLSLHHIQMCMYMYCSAYHYGHVTAIVPGWRWDWIVINAIAEEHNSNIIPGLCSCKLNQNPNSSARYMAWDPQWFWTGIYNILSIDILAWF